MDKKEQSQEKEKKKKPISKYDMVKVKIRIEDHFFIFSRYLLANLLRVIQVFYFFNLSYSKSSGSIYCLRFEKILGGQ